MHILNGNGAQAGLDAGDQRAPAGRRRHRLRPPGGRAARVRRVSLADDFATSPFGFKLASITSNLTGATVTGPSGSPPSVAVNLGANPNAGDTIAFGLTLARRLEPDHHPAGDHGLTAGREPVHHRRHRRRDGGQSADRADRRAIASLAQTALPAASAIAAANNFFNSNPPLRVSGAPATSTSLVAGTPANTVFWYTGESGATPARQTALAQVGPSTTIAYGMRANEQAITSLVANVAVLAATTYSASDPNAQTSYQALSQQVAANLDGQPGTQQINDIEADLVNAQTTMSNATNLNTQTQTTLTGHDAEHRRREPESDRRADFDAAKQPLRVAVGHGAARATEPGELSGAVERLVEQSAANSKMASSGLLAICYWQFGCCVTPCRAGRRRCRD